MLNTELVINYHITEKCNYDCKFCFAKWEMPNEIHSKVGQSELLIKKLADYFIDPKKENKTARLNFAGGEPMMLGKRFIELVAYAKEQGFSVSIITNAHYLTTHFIEQYSHYFSIIGISYDSQFSETQKKIGRIDRKNKQLSPQELEQRIKLIKLTSPLTQVKVNTVVNSLNWQENFTQFLSAIKPDKWKVLKVLPVKSNALTITSYQFESFVQRHKLVDVISVENNDSMTESYLMINPEGRFYQNKTGASEYVYSNSILTKGVAESLAEIEFNTDKFSSRYKPVFPPLIPNNSRYLIVNKQVEVKHV